MESIILRLLDYGIAATVLFWFMRRAEKRLDHLATQVRVLSFLIAEAHGLDRDHVHEIAAHGIVHGAFAFSVVFQFYSRLAKNNGYGLFSDKQLGYCRDRCDYELYRLQKVKDSLGPALQEMGDPQVRRLVMSWYEMSV